MPPCRGIIALRLEIIGTQDWNQVRLAKRLFRDRQQKRRWLLPEPWAAEITGWSEERGFTRRFLRPEWDYTHANALGTRGVFLIWFLRSGPVYEVCERLAWNAERRFFCRVEAGERVEMTKEEVLHGWQSI